MFGLVAYASLSTMKKSRQRFPRLGLILAGCLLGAVLTEGVARLALGGGGVSGLAGERAQLLEGASPAGGMREQGQFERSLELHPLWGYGGRAGKSAVNRFGFYSGKEFRLCADKLCLENKPDGALVIGIFGGSLALQVASDEAALERMLAPLFPGRAVLVVNFALPGHAAPQTVAAYQYFRDVVGLAIFLDGLNEIWNPAQNNHLGYPPVFAKAEHYRLLAGEAEGGRREIERLRRRLKAATERSLLPVWNRFTLSHAVWTLEKNYLLGRIAKLGGEQKLDAKPFFPASEDQLVALGVAEWELAHRQAERIAKDSGATFLHFLQPVALSGEKKLTDEEKGVVNAMPLLARLVRFGYPELSRRARVLGVRDLSHAFDSAGDTMWIDPAHVNEKGLEVLRAELAKAVATRAKH